MQSKIYFSTKKTSSFVDEKTHRKGDEKQTDSIAIKARNARDCIHP
jgi:hypothetical protein